ncbi:MAG: glycosyltransferase, partial [Lysobacterales bacterium]
PRYLRWIRALLRVVPSLYREFRRDGLSLTWFVLPEAYVIGGLVACAARLSGPMIMSRRSLNNYQLNHPSIGRLERWLHHRLFLILGNSQAVVRQLTDEEGVPRNRLRLIYNGVNSGLFEPARERDAIRASLNISPDAFVMIMVANLIPYKGHRDLVEALALAREHLSRGWRLLCVGVGEKYKRELVAFAEERGLERHILWLGERCDVEDLLNAADLGLLTSHQEGFSNALLEGMAAGLPMVVTDVGGNREAMVHGETGYMVASNAPKALAEAIVDLSGDQQKRRRFGDAARSRVRNAFSIDACVDQYHRLFSAVVEGRIPPACEDLTLEPVATAGIEDRSSCAG